MSIKSDIACENFKCGHNCCQAVVSAFDEVEFKDNLLKVASSFGGGVGTQRQLCGTVSGMSMVLGALKGYNTHEKGEVKKDQTQLVKAVCEDFKEVTGSVVCGELKGDEGFKEIEDKPKISCIELVRLATEIVEKYI